MRGSCGGLGCACLFRKVSFILLSMLFFPALTWVQISCLRSCVELRNYLSRMAAILRGYHCGDVDDDRFGYFALALLRRYYSLQRRRALYLGRMLRQEAGLDSGIIPWGRQGRPMGDVPGVGRCCGCRRAE